ncbi:hypothetical protein B0H17DRAFT_1216900 [Mycena rosella]|uniref:Uncharacterized protein n=1 Tax=Mycena rosella TaxID=1033263 RepID=A0AAD7C356_MYCRO|nr:hypothetical protein B0H17DRAFT_1216900 [Mycena rosella]
MLVGYTGVVLALHREMEYRATADTAFPLSLHDSRRHDRTALLWQQVHDMAVGALHGIVGWAHFCLAEADAVGGIPNDHINVFERVIGTLKVLGYAQDSPELCMVIERMEGYVLAYRAGDLCSTVNSGLSALTFPLDNMWMGILSADMGNLA